MAPRGETRASGITPAAEEAKKAVEAVEEPVEPTLPDERARKFRTPGFHRMRTAWQGEDAIMLSSVSDAIDRRVIEEWRDAYEVMNQVYDKVRTPEIGDDGKPVLDRWGYVVWVRLPHGGYDEDFSRLNHAQREHLLFLITTRMFEWEQRKERAWLESMLAKAQWEERFAITYNEATDNGSKDTIEGRSAVANKDAADERYFAIFVAGYSRRCDALVRALGLLGQRIRDSMMS